MGIDRVVVTTTVIMWADKFMHKHERHYRHLALEVYKEDMGDGVNVFRPTDQNEFVVGVQCATSEGGLLVISCHGGYFTRFGAFGFGGNLRSRIFAPISDLPDLGKLDLLVADSCYGASEGFIGELASKNLNQLIGHPGFGGKEWYLLAIPSHQSHPVCEICPVCPGSLCQPDPRRSSTGRRVTHRHGSPLITGQAGGAMPGVEASAP